MNVPQEDVATHVVEGRKLTFRRCVDDEGDVFFDVYDDTEGRQDDPLNLGSPMWLDGCCVDFGLTDGVPNEVFAQDIYKTYIQEDVVIHEVEGRKCCEDCGEEKKTFMKDVDGTNLEETHGCPKCDS